MRISAGARRRSNHQGQSWNSGARVAAIRHPRSCSAATTGTIRSAWTAERFGFWRQSRRHRQIAALRRPLRSGSPDALARTDRPVWTGRRADLERLRHGLGDAGRMRRAGGCGNSEPRGDPPVPDLCSHRLISNAARNRWWLGMAKMQLGELVAEPSIAGIRACIPSARSGFKLRIRLRNRDRCPPSFHLRNLVGKRALQDGALESRTGELSAS